MIFLSKAALCVVGKILIIHYIIFCNEPIGRYIPVINPMSVPIIEVAVENTVLL